MAFNRSPRAFGEYLMDNVSEEFHTLAFYSSFMFIFRNTSAEMDSIDLYRCTMPCSAETTIFKRCITRKYYNSSYSNLAEKKHRVSGFSLQFSLLNI